MLHLGLWCFTYVSGNEAWSLAAILGVTDTRCYIETPWLTLRAVLAPFVIDYVKRLV